MQSSTIEFGPTRVRSLGWWPAVMLVVVAFIIRAPQFGNPLVHVDEGFYLFVGDRMLQGDLPYVDIWDRKPIGLFLIYAAARLLGGDGIVQYQVLATLCAAATAVMVAALVHRMADRVAAVTAGCLYLFTINIAGGIGGQAPVFYNPLVIGAVMLTLGLIQDGEATIDHVRRIGCWAMALIGVALQIKYSVVFEGAFLGLALMAVAWRRGGSPARVAMLATLWIAVAMLPTLLAIVAYAALGHADAFIYANFLSITARGSEPWPVLLGRLEDTIRLVSLPLLCVVGSWWLEPWRERPLGASTFAFSLIWLAVAVTGYAVFGSYFDHYVLPLLVPLSVCAGPAFAYRRAYAGRIAAGAILIAGAAAAALAGQRIIDWRGSKPVMDRLVETIGDRAGKGCIYVYRGDPILYHLTRSCVPSRYAFPTHLTLLREAPALGVEPIGEVARILAGRPEFVVDTRYDLDMGDNSHPVDRLVLTQMAAEYRQVASIRIRLATIRVFRLIARDDPARRGRPNEV